MTRGALVLLGLIAMVCGAYNNRAYVVEVYIIADRQVVKNYMTIGNVTEAVAKTKIREDHEYYIYKTKEMFESLAKHGVNLELRSAGVRILDQDIFRYVKHDDVSIDGPKALGVVASYGFDYLSRHNYDALIAWTGYDIQTSKGKVEGYAKFETACFYWNVGLVRWRGTNVGATLTAHEIGHVIGMDHDEENSCPGSKFIMASGGGVGRKEYWTFSSCSADNFKKFTVKDNPFCLRHTTSLPIPKPPCQDGKDVLDPNKICQRTMGDADAYPNHEQGSSYMCLSLECSQKGKTNSRTMTPDGMVCGDNKRCLKGECMVADALCPAPSGFNQNCPFGEAGQVDGKTCKEHLDTQGDNQCYDDKVKGLCCLTCQQRKTTHPDCPFGEAGRVDGRTCKEYLDTHGDNQCYDDKVKQLCCLTCHQRKTTHPEKCPWGDRLRDDEGNTCEFKKRGKVVCYDPKQATLCCKSCHESKGSDPYCLWGDRLLANKMTCTEYLQRPSSRCTAYLKRETCCESCKAGSEGKSKACPFGDVGLPNGETCDGYLKKHGNAECYKVIAKERCCQTCENRKLKDGKKGCEWGDLSGIFPIGQKKLVPCEKFLKAGGKFKCTYPTIKGPCCHSCLKYTQ